MQIERFSSRFARSVAVSRAQGAIWLLQFPQQKKILLFLLFPVGDDTRRYCGWTGCQTVRSVDMKRTSTDETPRASCSSFNASKIVRSTSDYYVAQSLSILSLIRPSICKHWCSSALFSILCPLLDQWHAVWQLTHENSVGWTQSIPQLPHIIFGHVRSIDIAYLAAEYTQCEMCRQVFLGIFFYISRAYLLR